MQITYEPQLALDSADEIVTMSLAADVLAINSETHDLSGVTTAGADVVSTWILNPVVRDGGGELLVRVRLPHGAYAPSATRSAATITAGDGDITPPVFDGEAPGNG